MEAAKYASEEASNENSVGKTTREKIQNTLTEEIVIGICSPIGSLKHEVIEQLKKQLSKEYGYEVIHLKVSDQIPDSDEMEMGKSAEYTKMMNKIRGGNKFRQQYKLNSILIDYAIRDIYTDRHPENSAEMRPEEFTSQRKCYIIDSIKNKEELQVLRALYRDIFYMFSVFSPKEQRIKNLTAKPINKSEAIDLVEHDEYENNNDGQNVRNTFIEADFFVRVSEENKDKIPEKIKRYLELIFDIPVVTPLPEETAMYVAKSAAANSACLSRQVGASITDKEYRILSEGWNDVPQFKGGVYREDSKEDQRCWKKGICFNDSRKDDISEKATDKILNTKVFQELIDNGEKDKHEIRNIILKTLREESPLKDLIEFSRSVHAEMLAIISGSQKTGTQMRGGKLFTTTYPCHNCARHIVAAGIEEVYFIEPYVKSLCIELHNDSLTEKETESDKVKILIYDGVAPRRYQEFFFSSKPRKEGGKLAVHNKKTIKPKNPLTLQALTTLEQQAIHTLKEKGLPGITEKNV
ncbi:MAG: deoxycytidylate deaminase [Bacteroidia bacterium]|jgi:deoxycytidylate deaminase|nr:deoxycytidylate deaminase [Bacteroidia bacterium]